MAVRAIILLIIGLVLFCVLVSFPLGDLASFNPVEWLACSVKGFFEWFFGLFFGWMF